MNHPKKHKNIIKLDTKPLEDGLKMNKYNSKKQKDDIEDILSHPQQLTQQMQKNQLSIRESLPKNKKMTCNNKLTILKNNTPNTMSSQTLVQESTLKGRDFLSSLIKSSKEKLKKLWLPTKTYLQDLTSASSNLYVKSLDAKSKLFLKQNTTVQRNSLKISLQSLPSSQVDTMDLEAIQTKTKKIRFYPNQSQKELLNKFISTSRYIYNSCVSHNNNLYDSQLKKLKQSHKCNSLNCPNEKNNDQFFCKIHKKEKIKWDTITSPIDLRNEILIKNKDLKDNQKWLEETPYDCKELMIRSYITGLKNNLENKKSFEMQYKKKREAGQVIFVNKNAFSIKNNKLHFFQKKLKTNSNVKIKKIPKINHNLIILRKVNKYFLLIPFNDTLKKEDVYGKEVSLDPGIRTFQTFYSPNNICGDLNIRNDLLEKLNKRIQKLINKRSNSRINRKLKLSRAKITNLVSDGHWKIAKFLVMNFEKIYLPKFETQQLVKKEGKLSKKNRKKLLDLSHYKFQMKLKFKCEEYQRELFIVTEEYTSKTCGNCGYIKDNLGSNKTFKCNNCKIIIDRDLNASRNILIKNM